MEKGKVNKLRNNIFDKLNRFDEEYNKYIKPDIKNIENHQIKSPKPIKNQ